MNMIDLTFPINNSYQLKYLFNKKFIIKIKNNKFFNWSIFILFRILYLAELYLCLI
jgi:hypothetical protein